MADDFRKVTPGERFRFPARVYNKGIDAIKANEQRRHDRPDSASPRQGDRGVVRVWNNSGSHLDRFSVLAVVTPTILPTENLEVFQTDTPLTGTTPATADAGKFAVLLESTVTGAIGIALVSGVVTVKVDDGDGSTDFCDVANGVTDSLAMKSDGSARVLWRAAGTGKQWAVVRLGGGGGGGFFPVSLTQTGGANGTGTTRPTYSYTVKTIDGATTLLTGATPQVQRDKGFANAATLGTAYYGASGVVLFKSYEDYDVEPTCDTV